MPNAGVGGASPSPCVHMPDRVCIAASITLGECAVKRILLSIRLCHLADTSLTKNVSRKFLTLPATDGAAWGASPLPARALARVARAVGQLGASA